LELVRTSLRIKRYKELVFVIFFGPYGMYKIIISLTMQNIPVYGGYIDGYLLDLYLVLPITIREE
jgi:hypothetical protein